MIKTKKVIIIVSIIVFFLVLFAPIPKNINLDDGSAFSLTSLTYKIVFWDMYKESEKPYVNTEIFLLPKNFSSTQSIWDKKFYEQLSQNSVTSTFIVTKIENDAIYVEEIFTDSNSIKCIITKNELEKNGKDINVDNISKNTIFEITYDGTVLYTYPAMLGEIYEIKLVNTDYKNPVEDESYNENNSSEETTNNINSEISSNDNTPEKNIDNPSSIKQSSLENDLIPERFTKNLFDEQTFVKDIYYDEISGYTLPYTIILPYDYDPNTKYPVILQLHGAGHLGNDNTTQYSVIQRTFFYNWKWLNNALIISPQTNDWWYYDTNGETGNLNAVMRLFNTITNEYSCDKSRYYVLGGSMGGYATWQLALNCQDTFAAAMPLCGWWNTNDASKLCNIPIYITHGLNDTTVSPKKATEMYDAIINAGGKLVNIKLYENTEHDVWKLTLTDEEVLDWLFKQKNNQYR